MYAIIKAGSKQYRVKAGDAINIEKVEGKVGDKIGLETIFVSDEGKIEADPTKAAATKVTAEIVEQFKDKKVIVFKFKKRKNYQRKVGHRQPLTRVKITAVGSEKAPAEKKKAPAKKVAPKKEEAPKAEEKKTATKKAATTKTAEKKATEKKPAEKKTTTKKPAAKKAEDAKTEEKKED